MVEPSVVIQATLAPIFLVTGAAIFLNFTQARLFRATDRVRHVNRKLRELREGETGEDHADLMLQQRRLIRRALILRNAILFGVLVIAFTVMTTILLLTPSLFPGSALGRYAIACFTLALVSFAIALVHVVVDAFLSVAYVRHASREYALEGESGGHG